MAYLVSKKDRLPDTHKRSRNQEKTMADRVGGRQTSRSGAGLEKGDVRVKSFVRLECKTTKHDSFRVTRTDLDKIKHASIGHGEVPIIVVRLDGPPMLECAIVPLSLLDIIRERAEVC
jgi:Holliday junction resolvase